MHRRRGESMRGTYLWLTYNLAAWGGLNLGLKNTELGIAMMFWSLVLYYATLDGNCVDCESGGKE